MNVLTVLCLSVAVSAAQGRDDKLQLRPKYMMGQELTYVGTIVETVTGRQGVRYEQPYSFESTVLVLEVDPNRKSKLGCYTIVRLPGTQGNSKTPYLDQAESVHLDKVNVSPQGKATWAMGDAEILLPADGIAPWELGHVFEMPEDAVEVGGRWELRPVGQPAIQCQLTGMEVVDGVQCAKISTQQTSQNWKSEVISQSAWQNHTTLWWDVKTGTTQKVERHLSVREAVDPESTRVYTTNYAQAGNIRLRGQLVQERMRDFNAAFEAQTKLEKTIGSTGEGVAREFSRIKEQLTISSDQLYSTPYQAVMVYLHKQAEIAEKNPEAVMTLQYVGQNTLKLGKPARSIVFRDADDDTSLSLKKFEGTPVVLVVVNPSSLLSLQALSVAVKAVDGTPARLVAVCTEMNDEIKSRLRSLVPGEYLLCTGSGFDQAYGVTNTPHTIFVDGKGILRASFSGLGPEMYVSLGRELGLHAAPKQIGQKEQTPGSLR